MSTDGSTAQELLVKIFTRLASDKKPSRLGIFCDNDGTLSPFVVNPNSAKPEPDAVDSLHHLANSGHLTAVISGRPVSFLQKRFIRKGVSSPLTLSGLYSRQTFANGQAQTDPRAEKFRGIMKKILEEAQEKFATQGVSSGGKRRRIRIEDKDGLAIAFHTREIREAARKGGADPDVVAEVFEKQIETFCQEQVEKHGLEIAKGKMVWEITTPGPFDKEQAMRKLVRKNPDVKVIIFMGDDLGDISAFKYVRSLREQGYETLNVLVATAGTPKELRDLADLTLADTKHAASFLTELNVACLTMQATRTNPVVLASKMVRGLGLNQNSGRTR